MHMQGSTSLSGFRHKLLDLCKRRGRRRSCCGGRELWCCSRYLGVHGRMGRGRGRRCSGQRLCGVCSNKASSTGQAPHDGDAAGSVVGSPPLVSAPPSGWENLQLAPKKQEPLCVQYRHTWLQKTRHSSGMCSLKTSQWWQQTTSMPSSSPTIMHDTMQHADNGQPHRYNVYKQKQHAGAESNTDYLAMVNITRPYGK